jgi:hypothetical protein
MCVNRPSSQCEATSPTLSLPRPDLLGDATPSSRGGAPSRPWVAGAFGAACCASVDRPCAGQSALHMASTVRGCGTSAASPSGSLGDAIASFRGGSLTRPLVARPSPGGPLRCLGRSRLCRPVGLAHGLNRAQLRRLSQFALEFGIAPQTAGVFQACVSKNGRGRERGKVSGPGLALVEARTHVLLDLCDPPPCPFRITHSPPAPAFALALAPAARASHNDVLHPRTVAHHSHSHLPRAPPTTTTSPARLGTRQGALWHPLSLAGAARPTLRESVAGARTASLASRALIFVFQRPCAWPLPHLNITCI